MKPSRVVPAVEFKAKCLALLDEVAESRRPLVVTKRGRAVARVVPMAGKVGTSLKGTLLAQGDIVGPADDACKVDKG
jgi:prevent-host-death family protein